MPPPGVHLLHQSRAVCLESGDQHWPPLQSLAITGLPLPFNLGITKIKEYSKDPRKATSTQYH